MSTFRSGQKVVLMSLGSSGYTFGRQNPVWGERGLYIAGVVEYVQGYDRMNLAQTIEVRWENGERSTYNTREVQLEHLIKVKPEKTASGKKIDLTKLEPLVIDPKIKSDIIAVIKQHENHTKLFEEWGLGEVIQYGKGMTMLFWGGPGTGKTWGANCIARALGMEIISIGAAEIQTSEPGGANRNIQEAFKTAQKENKLLFIDECDSLVTSRENVGMIIGGEINTLLVEMEKFSGVCILATNRIEQLDEALERRISLIVEFPEPNHEARKAIWERMLPKKMPVHESVTPERLAEFKLTGGLIKNVLLSAARMAISNGQNHVTLENFESAITRTQDSQGKMGTRARQYGVMREEIGKARGIDKTRTTDKVMGE